MLEDFFWQPDGIHQWPNKCQSIIQGVHLLEEQQSCYDACKSIKHTCLVEHYSSVLADSNIYEADGSLIILYPGRHVQKYQISPATSYKNTV